MNTRLLIKSWAVDALYRAGIHRVLEPIFSGVGCVLCFHRVLPPQPEEDFGPNQPHTVDARFFEEILRVLRARGYDLVTISEAHHRLAGRDLERRFVCLTFDDGYRDNHDHAWPICQRYGAPMTLYLTSGFIDREMPVWWFALESVLRQRSSIRFGFRGRDYRYEIATTAEKSASFRALCDMFVALEPEGRRELAKSISGGNGVDFAGLSDEIMLTWQMVAAMARSDLVEFGAHTVNHSCLSTGDEPAVVAELEGSRRRLEEQIGYPIDHFAYPFGKRAHASRREFALARASGFATAVTTREGCLMAGHRDHLWCLPRVVVDGRLPTMAALHVSLTGTLAALTGRFARVITD
jgi:peptidoglycan/xylan/chitin deacetylase (PgdA/CDA1 family)